MKRIDLSEASALGKPGASIRFEHVSKVYSDSTVVADLNLSVDSGEFCTILGPSGSGKTTSLMMIAGFVLPDRGRILLDGRDITMLSPQRRDLGVVFQNYALFPHMSIFDNVAFPLKMRGTPRADIREAVRRMLELVQLDGLEERFPSQISGGQQQRVALARALVFEPRVLLMDEPLGALDKKLRVSLQLELKQLQRRLNVTVVYVTHDQEEALTMSDRIVVMRHGRIEQAGAPSDLYDRPETTFVANFIGETNVVSGILSSVSDGIGTVEHPTGRIFSGMCACALAPGSAVAVSVRPERMRLSRCAPSEGADDLNVAHGRVSDVTYLGEMIRYHVVIGEGRPSLAQKLTVKRPPSEEGGFELGETAFVTWSRRETRLLQVEGDDD